MFYEYLDRIWKVALIVLLGFLQFRSMTLEEKKKKEYKEDERWQLIQAKSYQIVTFYYDMLIGLFIIFYMVTMFTEFRFSLTGDNLFSIVGFVFIIRYPIKYLAIRYFDKRL